MPVHKPIRLLAAITVCLLLGACRQASPQVVKIGLVAPFEGRYREIGLDVIPAVRLAIREWAAQHPDSTISIELVAYDDAGDPKQAIEQAQKLTADPAVKSVIGHWRDNTTLAALDTYEEANLSVVTFTGEELSSDYNLAPANDDLLAAIQAWLAEENLEGRVEIDLQQESVIDAAAQLEASLVPTIGNETWGLTQFYSLSEGVDASAYFVSGYALVKDMTGGYWTESRETFEAGFRDGSLDAPPGIFSAAAYEAAWVALDLVSAEYGFDTTSSPVEALNFDEHGRRVNAPIYLYQWIDGSRRLLEVFD